MKVIGIDNTSGNRTTNYLQKIRANSAYTTFRVVVNVVQWLFVIAGVVLIVGSFYANDNGTFFGLVFGFSLILIGKVGKQSTVMLADIADATIDMASKQSE